MNYRHAYHAGNFADVFKHILLTRIVSYLQRKDKPFRVFDTHGGLGLYDLRSEEAQSTEEAGLGIGKLKNANVPKAVSDLIEPYLNIVNKHGDDKYPGSPVIIHELLRKIDRLTIYELHGEDSHALGKLFSDDYQTRVYPSDGWLVSVSHIPPKEGRGLILVDPPFEDGNDFNRMLELVKNTNQRWRGATVALWYPVKKRSHTDDWLESIRLLRLPDVIAAELYIQAPHSARSLNGCGMVIVNPPYVMKSEIETVLPWLSTVLSQGQGSGYRVLDLSASKN